MRKYGYKKESQSLLEDRLHKYQLQALKRITGPSKFDELVDLIGLSEFRAPPGQPLPKGFHRVGGGIRSSADEYRHLFYFGELRGCRVRSLPNLFHLSVAVVCFPDERNRFYVHVLDGASENLVKKALPKLRKTRDEAILKNMLRQNRSWILRDAVTLLSHTCVRKSDDHPFEPKPNFKRLDKIIRNIKKAFIVNRKDGLG